MSFDQIFLQPFAESEKAKPTAVDDVTVVEATDACQPEDDASMETEVTNGALPSPWRDLS
jgi:hypothetical protein